VHYHETTDVCCETSDFDDANRDWGDMLYFEATSLIGDYFLRDPSPFVRGLEVQMMRMFNTALANELHAVRRIQDAQARGAGASALFLSWHVRAILSGVNAAWWQVLPEIY